MLSSSPAIATALPHASSPPPEDVQIRSCYRNSNRKFSFKAATSLVGTKDLRSFMRDASKDSNAFLESDVPFPSDYAELLGQAKQATELAIKDGKQMMFFPEASEVQLARKSAFEGASFKLDYLTKPSFFEDFGFGEKVKMADRVKPEDELFLVGYPYFNVNEMLVVEELYKEAVMNTARKLIIFNGELDRIRSGYYPSFFYPKLAALTRTLLPMMETVYYIHNFKGANGGTLFRCYPGSWKVVRRVRDHYVCLHQQEAMPSLKEVALDILPSAR